MNDELLKVLITSAVTLVGSWLLFRGGKRTADASKAASENASHVDAQESALQAWQALLQPHIDDLARVRSELDAERSARVAEAEQIAAEQATQRLEMTRLQSEVTRWQQVAKTIARWATQLRDEVLKLGGTVPATPEELLTLQAIDDAADRRTL